MNTPNTPKLIELWNFNDESTTRAFLKQLNQIYAQHRFESHTLLPVPADYPSPSTKIPHLVVINQERPLTEAILKSLDKLLTIDPHTVVIRVIAEIPTGAEVRTTLGTGVHYFIKKPFDLSGLSDSLNETLTQRFLKHTARTPRVSAHHKITLHLASIEQALASETINIGSGGLFVRLVVPEVVCGDIVEFELQLGSELSSPSSSYSSDPIEKLSALKTPPSSSPTLLSGSGKVLWIRARAESAAAPEGMGIQFQKVSPEIHKLIEKYLHRSSKAVPES